MGSRHALNQGQSIIKLSKIKMAQHLDLRCGLALGAGAKIRLESSIKKFNPHQMYGSFFFLAGQKKMTSQEVAHRAQMSQCITRGALATSGPLMTELPEIRRAQSAAQSHAKSHAGSHRTQSTHDDGPQQPQSQDFKNLLSHNVKMLQNHMNRYNRLRRQRSVRHRSAPLRYSSLSTRFTVFTR